MYKFKLVRDGYEVDVAHTGPEGLELVKRKRPHLLLLDLKLPHMNGEEVLRRIRQTDWGAYLRVLIIANVGRNFSPKVLEELHFDNYLIKAEHTPQQISDIIREILEVLSNSAFTERSS